MSNSFTTALENPVVTTKTEYGETVFLRTGNPFVDWLNLQSRVRDDKQMRPNYHYDRSNLNPLETLKNTFAKMYDSNPLWARRLAFASYNIRGGNGNRSHFRVALRYMVNNDLEYVIKNWQHIPHFGRWDMLIELHEMLEDVNSRSAFDLQNTIVRYCAYNLATEYKNFSDGNPQNSLIAKWMPSHSTKKKYHKKFVTLLIKELFGSYNAQNEKRYRKMLTEMRNELRIVETFMSNNNWREVSFENLPGVALRKYIKAWERHLPTEWQNYLQDVEDGKKSMNATTIDFVEMFKVAVKRNTYGFTALDKTPANAMWENRNKASGMTFVPVVDMSGSMYSDRMGGLPLATAMTVGLHVAEMNVGDFHNVLFTFAETPKVVRVQDEQTFSQKLNALFNSRVGYSTNLYRVFELYLNTAKRSDVKIEDLPKGILVVSDMEVSMGDKSGENVWNKIEKMFAKEDMPMPHMVWWNATTNSKAVVKAFNKHCTVVSGSSPTLLRYIAYGDDPLDAVIKIVNDPMYEMIV